MPQRVDGSFHKAANVKKLTQCPGQKKRFPDISGAPTVGQPCAKKSKDGSDEQNEKLQSLGTRFIGGDGTGSLEVMSVSDYHVQLMSPMASSDSFSEVGTKLYRGHLLTPRPAGGSQSSKLHPESQP